MLLGVKSKKIRRVGHVACMWKTEMRTQLESENVKRKESREFRRPEAKGKDNINRDIIQGGSNMTGTICV